MKLALIIASLDGGGAERVMSVLANAWAARGHDVVLMTLDRAGNEAYALEPAIHRIGLDLLGESRNTIAAITGNLTRVWRLRDAIQRCGCDVVVSFMTSTNILTVLAATGLRVPVIVCERNAPDMQDIGCRWRVLRRLVLPRATVIVVQTKAAARWIEQRMPRVAVAVVPNPVSAVEAETLDVVARSVLRFCGQNRVLVAIGRLHHQKGFDLLIRAFSRICRRYPEWRLVILGEGGERAKLESSIAKLGISQHVLLPGFTTSPYRVLQRADIFVLSSRYEGQPNALLEAMAAGRAVVSFDCPSGPADLIRDAENGLLVSAMDEQALYRALQKLVADARLRRRLGAAARQSVEPYSLEAVMHAWDAVFHEPSVGL